MVTEISYEARADQIDLGEQVREEIWKRAHDQWIAELITGSGTGGLRGILNMPGVATLVDDGVTRGPFAEPVHAITWEDVCDVYRRLTPPAYRAAALLPPSAVSHG